MTQTIGRAARNVNEPDYVTVDAGIARDGMLVGHNLKATIADMEKGCATPWRTLVWRRRRG